MVAFVFYNILINLSIYFDKKKAIARSGASLLSQPSMGLEQDSLDNSFKIKSKESGIQLSSRVFASSVRSKIQSSVLQKVAKRRRLLLLLLLFNY